MLQLHGEKRTPADQRTCYYLMRAVRLDRQTRPALVPIRDKSRSPLTSKNPPKPHDCASAPLAPPHKPPAKSHLIMRAQRGANSPLPHCGLREGDFPTDNWRQRGANSPLPHCGPAVAAPRRVGGRPTRGEFAPPSLRRVWGGLSARQIEDNEGRIRPSLIAAARLRGCLLGQGRNEGRIRPSLIAASEGLGPPVRAVSNEGRIRPSLIAAHHRCQT